MSQLIYVICQIVGSGVVGMATYWLSSKLWPASVKKDAMTHILKHALSPILAVIRPAKRLPIADLISDINSIDKIMKDNPFDIPPLHKCKMNDINRFIELYEGEQTNCENRKVLEREIRKEYSSYVTMFNIQCNYVKKQLGYPYSNFYDSLRYETGSPFFSTLFLSLLFIMWISIYAFFLIKNEFLKAILILFVPAILFVIYAIIYRVLKNRGGIRVIINNIKSKHKNDSKSSNDLERQK